MEDITRESALGSHAPFAPTIFDANDSKKDESTAIRHGRPRRATLPSVIINPPEPESQEHAMDTDQGVAAEDKNIGFAVTSGSHPKRRSRSADAHYDIDRTHRMSPIQWRQWRRRSDEIKYWRESIIDGSPILDPRVQLDDKAEEDRSPSVKIRDSILSEPEDVFDFGLLAPSIQDQDKTTLAERVVTLEVKLMDLEYAISKMQARRSPSPAASSTHKLRPTLPRSNPSTASSSSGIRRQDQDTTTVAGTKQLMSNTSTGVEQKLRPLSIATVRPQTALHVPHTETDAMKTGDRTSIASITIDHYVTLIGLIRREQAARIHLEDQVSHLRRQLLYNKSPSPPHSRSRTRPWHGNGHCYRSKDSYEREDTDTEDGFHEVYETPTERREFEGAAYGSASLDGEAF